MAEPERHYVTWSVYGWECSCGAERRGDRVKPIVRMRVAAQRHAAAALRKS